jgi:ABC-type multidrug transport system fused ATPase/permease subunit
MTCAAAKTQVFGEALFVFVWFSDDRRLAVIVRFVVVLLLLVIIIVGISRRHRVTDKAQQSENALGDARGHVGLPLDVTTFTD